MLDKKSLQGKQDCDKMSELYLKKIHKQELKYVESNFHYPIEMFENILQVFRNN